MRNKKTTIVILVFFVLLSGIIIKVGFSKSNNQNKIRSEKGKSLRKVDALVVKPTLLDETINVTGTLQAFEAVNLQSEVSGRVVQINLPEGKSVKKGTLLVKIFDEDLQATLHKLQTQLAIQQQIYNRQKELIKVNGISRNEYEQTGLQINSLKADIEVEKAMIRKTEVRAPFDGIIGLRNISIGEIVTPTTPLANIRTANHLKLDFYVPEKYSDIIKSGMQLKFTVESSSNDFSATVFATEQGIEDATRNLKVRAKVTSSVKNLIPGTFANLQLRLHENKNALMIPSRAIIPRAEKNFVYLVRNGKAELQAIKIGVRRNSNVEITDGIQFGDTVITSGILFIKKGAKLSYSTITK